MPENPKQKKEGTVAEDQEERGYYYDDAHGYENYEPEPEEGEAEDDAETGDNQPRQRNGIRKPAFRTCECGYHRS